MFVAVWPDGSTRDLVASLGVPPVPGLRLVLPEDLHITLRFLGDVDELLVPRLVEVLESAARSLVGPVRCVLGPGTAWFAGDRVLQIPVAGLDATAAAFGSATTPVVPDEGTDELPFVGHLTIARATRGGDAAARAAVAGTPFSSSFRVDAIHLVGSRRSADGPRYPTLGRVRLPG